MFSYSLFAHFDWNLLNRPGFKEDSVREELITPLLNALGYTASGPHHIHRSLNLKHPFVYLGSKSYRISLIPDYLLDVSGKHQWVLDAKAPNESTRNGANPQQAYSYAIHPDIRARYFALCNGRDFTVFDIYLLRPVMDFPLREISTHWQDLAKLLGPDRYSEVTEELAPDLGLHLHRLGFGNFEKIWFILTPIGHVSRISDTQFSISGAYDVGELTFCASFDFDHSLLPEFIESMPVELRTNVRERLSRYPFQVDLRSSLPMINLECQLGKSVAMTHNKTEAFCPFEVVKMTGPNDTETAAGAKGK